MHELLPEGMLEDRMFIPTRIDRHIEEEGCSKPSEENGWKCVGKKYKMKKMEENVYVADIERYTLLFTHSYHRGTISGSNLFHQGYFEACENPTTG
jgi:hypothetical protein